VQNFPFDQKKKAYIQHNLRMVQQVCQHDDWTFSEIEKREAQIVAWAKTDGATYRFLQGAMSQGLGVSPAPEFDGGSGICAPAGFEFDPETGPVGPAEAHAGKRRRSKIRFEVCRCFAGRVFSSSRIRSISPTNRSQLRPGRRKAVSASSCLLRKCGICGGHFRRNTIGRFDKWLPRGAGARWRWPC
jgi:hypothetical protein